MLRVLAVVVDVKITAEARLTVLKAFMSSGSVSRKLYARVQYAMWSSAYMESRSCDFSVQLCQ